MISTLGERSSLIVIGDGARGREEIFAAGWFCPEVEVWRTGGSGADSTRFLLFGRFSRIGG
jgi:hypothetical protein